MPLEFHGQPVLTLRQIDRLNRVAKGTAFRAFKAARPRLRPEQDFFRVDAQEHPQWMVDLKAAGQHYASSVHLVLIARSGYAALELPAPWPEGSCD